MRVLATFGLLAIGSLASAQDDILAVTDSTQYLVRQTMDSNCGAARCLVSFEKAAASNAGGSAYDGRTGYQWVTNGTALTAYLPPDGTTTACKQPCSVQKIPQPLATSVTYCTGLAILEAGDSPKPGATSRIYFLYANNYIGVADLRGCTLANYKACPITGDIGTANVTGGLACDDLNRYLFVGTYQSSAGVVVYVYDADAVCKAICKFVVTVTRPGCSAALGSCTGLAYNACSRMLYTTDGKQTAWGLVTVSSAGCTYLNRACCPNPVSEAFTGLALSPPRQGRLGKPCSAPVCNNCTPTLSTIGDAVLGNGNFAVVLNGGPSNTDRHALAIGIGHCSAPGVPLGFCQPALVSLAAPGPFVFLFGATPVAGTCNFNRTIPLPLPAIASGCDLKLSFQWVMSCRGNPIGNAMSDCLSVTLAAN